MYVDLVRRAYAAWRPLQVCKADVVNDLEPSSTPESLSDVLREPAKERCHGPVGRRHGVIPALRRVAPKDLRVLSGVNVLRRAATDRLLIPDIAVVDADAARKAAAADSASMRPEDIYLASR